MLLRKKVQIPTWIILIQIIPLPIFLIILTMTSLDLVKQDYVTIRGKLVEKKVYTVGVLMENGKVKKFRAHKEFVKEIKELKLQQEIEIQYYRRTKAVTQIKKLIEPEFNEH
ncbi:hypothetical protein [Paenibacillus sp. NPDC057967]|uniref:hypothetical protein n=1 Tax=Paenibacillus sp. NPDC057967 TaxID=3346293 RepID=UPI0036DA100A